jgi:hypothetical protein
MKTSEQYLKLAVKSLIAQENKRDLGKLYAPANEHFQSDWINENCSFQVKLRDDYAENKNAGGYDIIGLPSYKQIRVQSKIRIGNINFEQTRRKSIKHKGAISSGHVVYSVNELDVFLVTRPIIKEYDNMSKWALIALPAKAIENPKTPGYIYTTVPKKIWEPYVGKTLETLEAVYESI